ncbi:hypothetical protein LB557_01090 [Mesorhizobium sp. BR115XR7A]|nr:hypothetical protein [Mesorhizobium sp. BR115XR7A]MBZ9904602.1 hypothetical protein [Mesorhizobium sp. BR115XR7A]MBZ9932989.1 hypothetical protein [Mesorhizobium sp. BR1-1-5]
MTGRVLKPQISGFQVVAGGFAIGGYPLPEPFESTPDPLVRIDAVFDL